MRKILVMTKNQNAENGEFDLSAGRNQTTLRGSGSTYF